ncbi:hypothetical protein B0T21DRAFT_280366, partial [Apiosordaria backusii]
WEEAEKLFVQLMETSKTKLGGGHPSSLTTRGGREAGADSHTPPHFTWKGHGRRADVLAVMQDCVQARQRLAEGGEVMRR